MGWMASLEWYKVEQLPWPADWPEMFGRVAPLLVEIGFGSGLFLADLARRRPQANIVGLEIAVPSLRNAARKIQRGGLTNVRLMQAGAAPALQALFDPESIEGVIINFPDPWPKQGHLNRRLIDEEFLRLLATRMQPASHLDIATDHADYALQIAGCLQRSPDFNSRLDTPYTHNAADRIRTKYEQIALAEGRSPFYFRWRRNEEPASYQYPIPKELMMPHVVIRLPADTAEIGRRFRPTVVELGETRVRFVEAYQSLHDGKLMIETYIKEDPILQRVGLEVRQRASGEVVISLAEVGFPRPTAGVHVAISSLVRWLRQEFPSLIVVHTTLQGENADTAHKRD